MYPLSFSRLKNISISDAAFIAGCVLPKPESTRAQMLGRVIHQALLFGDYKKACKLAFNGDGLPNTIDDMKKLVGELRGGRKDDYEAECSKMAILTLAKAKEAWADDKRDFYNPEDVPLIDALVTAAGPRFELGQKEYHFTGDIDGVPVHGYIDHLHERLTDIKTYFSKGHGFFQVAANMKFLEQLAFYEECGLNFDEFSIYAVELGEGFATSQEFIFDRNGAPMKEARARVLKWVRRAKELEPLVTLAKEKSFISLRQPDFIATDSDMPMYFYQERVV